MKPLRLKSFKNNFYPYRFPLMSDVLYIYTIHKCLALTLKRVSRNVFNIYKWIPFEDSRLTYFIATVPACDTLLLYGSMLFLCRRCRKVSYLCLGVSTGSLFYLFFSGQFPFFRVFSFQRDICEVNCAQLANLKRYKRRTFYT